MVEIEVLSTFKGHKTIYIEEGEPEKRAELFDAISKMLEQKYAVFLVLGKNGEDTRRIMGYDPDKNEWILQATIDERTASSVRKIRRSAQNSRVAAIAATAGG
jgi:hypothetical protein